MEFNIRAMIIDDYDAVIALWQATEGMGLSAADSREAIARYLERNPGMSAVATDSSGAIAGAVLCGHDGRRGYLHHLAVRAEHRGLGLGRRLAETVLKRLQAEGIDKCHLFVYKSNATGRAFWEATGWVERTTLLLMSKDVVE